MERERYEDVVDATRRTRLAGERTYLAWWRSALAAFAVSLQDPLSGAQAEWLASQRSSSARLAVATHTDVSAAP